MPDFVVFWVFDRANTDILSKSGNNSYKKQTSIHLEQDLKNNIWFL